MVLPAARLMSCSALSRAAQGRPNASSQIWSMWRNLHREQELRPPLPHTHPARIDQNQFQFHSRELEPPQLSLDVELAFRRNSTVAEVVVMLMAWCGRMGEYLHAASPPAAPMPRGWRPRGPTPVERATGGQHWSEVVSVRFGIISCGNLGCLYQIFTEFSERESRQLG